jgi:hypothetical protein
VKAAAATTMESAAAAAAMATTRLGDPGPAEPDREHRHASQRM